MVLFDEIEKAHPDVFNALLQVLDDGRLTDGQGRTVDFRNTVLILTSNVGSSDIQEAGGDARKAKGAVMAELKATFRPEFLNRVDEIVLFDALSLEALRRIVDIQITRLDALLAARHLRLILDEEVRDHLAAQGYDPVYGARPLKRALQRTVQDPLALALLDGRFEAGAVIRGVLKDGQLGFEKVAD